VLTLFDQHKVKINAEFFKLYNTMNTQTKLTRVRLTLTHVSENPYLVYSISLYCNESLYQISRKSYENFKRYAYFLNHVFYKFIDPCDPDNDYM
jgi:hypothetical protein